MVSPLACVALSKRRAGSGSSRLRCALRPAAKHLFGVGGLDLLRIAPVIDAKQRVVARVGGTADRVADDNDPEPEIDRAQHGSENADVGLGAGNDQSVGAAFAQMLQQRRLGKARISRL